MKDATRVIRGTLTEAVAGEPLHAGPVFAAPYHLAGNAGTTGYTYGRSGNPTWTRLEAAIAGLEGAGAEVSVFGSGMAAVAAVYAVTLRAGDVVALPRGIYFLARQLLEEVWVPLGVEVRMMPAGEMMDPAKLRGVRLAWVETPSNPGLEVTDIAAVVAAAREAGALVAVDNTTMCPYAQKPLVLGADFSVCSDSKAMSGHSDLLLGHVAVTDAEWAGKIDRHRTLTGGVPGPMEAWLLLRSLGTLGLRMERSCANALELARWLEGRVGGVVYPGLASHAGYEVAGRQAGYFGFVIGLELPGREAAVRFLEGAEGILEATSFGGISTTADRRARWGHGDAAEGFLRLSVGCEDVEDLKAALAAGLAAVEAMG